MRKTTIAEKSATSDPKELPQLPFAIYFMWHPDFFEGEVYAQEAYHVFTRNLKEPLSRSVGIPVFFLSASNKLELPTPINHTEAQSSLLVVLFDDNMIVDTNWITMIESEIKMSSSKRIILPVAFGPELFELDHTITSLNAIRLYQFDEARKMHHLINHMAYLVAGLLYNTNTNNALKPKRLKIFISHTKIDGQNIALMIRDHIQRYTIMSSFFDVHDIYYGVDFGKEIEDNLRDCVFLALKSDKYATREWCHRELLLAKKHRRPIVVVDMLEHGEERSFPYMANTQNLRINKDELNEQDIDEILFHVVLEAARYRFQQLYARKILLEADLSLPQNNIYAVAPELMTLLEHKEAKNQLIVYPDPPIGTKELALLEELNPELSFVTPTSVFLIKK